MHALPYSWSWSLHCSVLSLSRRSLAGTGKNRSIKTVQDTVTKVMAVTPETCTSAWALAVLQWHVPTQNTAQRTVA